MGMATTVTAGLRIDFDLYLGHVGDCRAYLVRNGEIRQLTEDHSVVADLVKQGVITADEARSHPDRAKIFRSLGVTSDIRVDTCGREDGAEKLSLLPGDRLVFCSDGLTGHLPDAEILRWIEGNPDADQACRALIGAANAMGGGDNITVIVVGVAP
jgi:protein phosphatase